MPLDFFSKKKNSHPRGLDKLYWRLLTLHQQLPGSHIPDDYNYWELPKTPILYPWPWRKETFFSCIYIHTNLELFPVCLHQC